MSRFLPSCDSAYHRDRSPPRGPRALLDASWGPALGPAGTPGFGRGRGPRGDYREYRDRRSSPPQPRDRSTVRGRGRGDWAYSRAWSGHERDERRKDREREADLYKRDRQADHRPFSASPRASTAQEHSRRPELSRHRIPDGAASPPHAPQGIPLGPAARPLPPIVPLPSARRASSPPRPATHHQSNTNNSHPQPVFAPRSVPTGPRAHKSSQTPNAPRPDRGDRGPERGIAQEQREASLAEGATSRPSSSTSSQALASRNTADHGTLGGKRDIIPIAAPKGPKADRKPEWTAPRGTPTRPHQWVRPGFQHQARSSLIPAKRNARGDERANRHSLIPEEALSSTLSLDMSEAHGHSQQSQQSQLPPLEGEELSQTVGLEAASKGLSPAPSLHENGFSSLVPSKVEPKLMIVPSAPIFEQKTTTPQATEHVKDMAADATFAESKFEELAANLIQSEKSTMAIKHAAENMPPHITLLSEPARTPNEPTPSQNGMAAIAQSPEPSSPKHDVPDEIVPNPFPESESSDKRHPSASFTPAPSPNAEGKQPAAQIHLPRREKGLNCRDASTISNLPFVAKLPLEDLDCIKDTLLNHEKNEDIFLTLLVQQKQVLENQRLAEKSEYKSNYITWRKERILDDERTVAARVAAETRRGKKYSSEFDIEQVIKESEITAEEDRAKLNSGVGWGNYKKEATIPEMVQDDFSNPKAYVFQDQEHWVAGHLAHETLEFFHQKRNFTEEEQAQFLSKYIQFPKRFDKIAEELPGRTISDCIAYYYQTKGEKKYKDRITKSLRGKKGRRTDQAMMAKPKSNALMSNALVNPDREDAEEEQAFQKAQRASNTFATSSETIAVTETGRPRRAAAPIFGEPATEADSSLSNIPSTKKNFNSFKIDFAAESISERPSKRAKAASTRGRGPGRGKIATTAAPVVLAREPDKFGMEKEREIEKEREFEREMESKREESEREKEKETAEENFQVARLPSFQIAPAAVPLVAQNLIESSKPLPPDTGSQPSYPDILEGPRFGQQTRQIQTTSSYWSVPEVQDFPRLLSHFGTNWSNIANHMGSKTHIMVKNYYARQLEGGASDLEEIARRADAKIARGDMAGQPPTMTPLPKKRYEAHATVPSQYLAPNNTESAVFDDSLSSHMLMPSQNPSVASPQTSTPPPHISTTSPQMPPPSPHPPVPSPRLSTPSSPSLFGLNARLLNMNKPGPSPALSTAESALPRSFLSSPLATPVLPQTPQPRAPLNPNGPRTGYFSLDPPRSTYPAQGTPTTQHHLALQSQPSIRMQSGLSQDQPALRSDQYLSQTNIAPRLIQPQMGSNTADLKTHAPKSFQKSQPPAPQSIHRILDTTVPHPYKPPIAFPASTLSSLLSPHQEQTSRTHPSYALAVSSARPPETRKTSNIASLLNSEPEEPQSQKHKVNSKTDKSIPAPPNIGQPSQMHFAPQRPGAQVDIHGAYSPYQTPKTANPFPVSGQNIPLLRPQSPADWLAPRHYYQQTMIPPSNHLHSRTAPFNDRPPSLISSAMQQYPLHEVHIQSTGQNQSYQHSGLQSQIANQQAYNSPRLLAQQTPGGPAGINYSPSQHNAGASHQIQTQPSPGVSRSFDSYQVIHSQPWELSRRYENPPDRRQ